MIQDRYYGLPVPTPIDTNFDTNPWCTATFLGEPWWKLKTGSTFKSGLLRSSVDEQGFICNQGVASSILASSTSTLNHQ